MIGVGSPVDPLVLPESCFHLPANFQRPSAVGKTVRDPRLNIGEATGVFIYAGQSLSGNTCDTLYTPTHSTKVDNLNILDGGLYAAVDPLLGCNEAKGNTFARIADKWITAGKYARVILIPLGIGSTYVADHAPGGAYNSLYAVAFARAKALGYTVNGVFWQQGEQDGVGSTTTTQYETSLSALISQQRGLGNTAPWLLARSTVSNNVASSKIQAAYAALINGTYIFAGADTDSLGSADRQSDGTHLNATGADANATLWVNAWTATGF